MLPMFRLQSLESLPDTTESNFNYTNLSETESQRGNQNVFKRRENYSIKTNKIKEGKFYFRKRQERLNWRMLAAIDINKVMRELDIQSLQDVLSNLTYCDIQNEDLRYVDPNFVKLFQLSQLIVEYVLFCQKQLVKDNNSFKTDLTSMQSTQSKLSAELEKLTVEANALRKENRSLKKNLFAYQMMCKMTSSTTTANNADITSCTFPCRYCDKAFTTSAYLSGHLIRRHPELPDYTDASAARDAAKKETDPVLEKLSNVMEAVMKHLAETETFLKNQADAKLKGASETKSGSSKALLEHEILELKTSLHREFESERLALQQERSSLEKALQQKLAEKQSNAMPKKSNRIGSLEDDSSQEFETYEEHLLKKFEEKQQTALFKLQENFHNDLVAIQSGMNALGSLEQNYFEKALTENKINYKSLKDYLSTAPNTAGSAAATASPPAPSAEPVNSTKTDLETAPTSETEVERIAIEKLRKHRELLELKLKVSYADNLESHAKAMLSWDSLLNLWALHHFTPIPNEPWVFSLYNHANNLIDYQKELVSQEVNMQVQKSFGLSDENVSQLYGKSDDIDALFKQGYSALNKKQLEKTTSNPTYGKMRSFLEQEMNQILSDNFVPSVQPLEPSTVDQDEKRDSEPDVVLPKMAQAPQIYTFQPKSLPSPTKSFGSIPSPTSAPSSPSKAKSFFSAALKRTASVFSGKGLSSAKASFEQNVNYPPALVLQKTPSMTMAVPVAASTPNPEHLAKSDGITLGAAALPKTQIIVPKKRHSLFEKKTKSHIVEKDNSVVVKEEVVETRTYTKDSENLNYIANSNNATDRAPVSKELSQLIQHDTPQKLFEIEEKSEQNSTQDLDGADLSSFQKEQESRRKITERFAKNPNIYVPTPFSASPKQQGNVQQVDQVNRSVSPSSIASSSNSFGAEKRKFDSFRRGLSKVKETFSPSAANSKKDEVVISQISAPVAETAAAEIDPRRESLLESAKYLEDGSSDIDESDDSSVSESGEESQVDDADHTTERPILSTASAPLVKLETKAAALPSTGGLASGKPRDAKKQSVSFGETIEHELQQLSSSSSVSSQATSESVSDVASESTGSSSQSDSISISNISVTDDEDSNEETLKSTAAPQTAALPKKEEQKNYEEDSFSVSSLSEDMQKGAEFLPQNPIPFSQQTKQIIMEDDDDISLDDFDDDGSELIPVSQRKI